MAVAAHPRMMRSLFAFATSVLVVACSSGDGNEPQDGGPQDGSPHDGAALDAGHDGALEASNDAPGEAQAPPAPSCPAGDRKEFAGAIPNTVISVAVCSVCGESYVIAASGSASASDVTVANGASTITTNIPANGTATSAKVADDPSDGTVTVCGTSGTHGCLAAAVENKQYCNPFRSVAGLVPERIDQGVDYAGSGSIYAMGPGTLDVYYNRTDTGWPGGTFVSYQLSAGPANGKTIYLAENIDLNPKLKSGSYVFSGTVLGTLVNAYPNSESGWGVKGAGYTAEYSCYTEGCTTALGSNFNDLLVCLKAPSGITETTGCCTSTAGYPSNWCTLLSSWQ